MLELAAIWLMVSLITGIYLWWPQNQPAPLAQKAPNRVAWKRWHAVVGLALNVMSPRLLLHRDKRARKHVLGVAIAVVFLHLLLIWAWGLARKPDSLPTRMLVAYVTAAPATPPRGLAATPPLLSQRQRAVPAPAPTAVAPPLTQPSGRAAPAFATASVSGLAAEQESSLAPSSAAQTDTAVRVAATLQASGTCQKPAYPELSRRREEQGSVQLEFLIGIDGHVLETRIEQSSGYPRLDEAARAGLSRCQFQPGTVNGRPEPSWARLKYTWRLE